MRGGAVRTDRNNPLAEVGVITMFQDMDMGMDVEAIRNEEKRE